MTEATYSDVIGGYRKAVDSEDYPESLAIWGSRHIGSVIGVLSRENVRANLAEQRLRGEAPMPIEKCGARAVGGPCVLAAGHNVGQPDVPQNHRTGPAHRNERAHAIGRELVEIDKAIDHLVVIYGNHNRKADVYDSDVFTELSNRRDVLRTELFEMG